MVLSVLRRIESRGVIDTAHRARENISQVMRYAIATGRAERDPCPDLRGALPPIRQGHMAAITSPVEAGGILRAMDAFKVNWISVVCTSGSVAHLKSAENGPFTGVAGSMTTDVADGGAAMNVIPPPSNVKRSSSAIHSTPAPKGDPRRARPRRDHPDGCRQSRARDPATWVLAAPA
jgi:hypothetical protein